MRKRSFFLFFILLLTLPLSAIAQEKKICRLCDPLDPPKPLAKEPIDEPLGDRVIMAWTLAWNNSDSGFSNFFGGSFTFLFTKYFGMDFTFEANEAIGEIPLEDQESRVDLHSSLSGLWFFNGIKTNKGFSPYGKMGIVYQEMVRHDSGTDDIKNLSIPFALQIGAGLMARYGILYLGTEVIAISPGLSEENELVNGSLNLRIFVGLHVNGYLLALSIPFAFII